MPDGQEPTSSASVAAVVHNTTGVKVYSRLAPTDEWKIDNGLICLSHSVTKGSKIGMAQFSVLMPNNDTASDEWQEVDDIMRCYAANTYNLDMRYGYQIPYLVMVTDIFKGVEKPVWYGYISTVDQDQIAERVSVTGLAMSGLLDQQEIIGGWYLNRLNTVDYYIDYIPVYNPNGVGNRSSQVLPSSKYYDIYGVDQTLLKNEYSGAPVDPSIAMWRAKDMLYQVVGRLENSLYSSGNNFNPYRWAEDVYGDGYSVIEMDDEVEKILEETSQVDSYTLQGKKIWQALVEIVESVDGLVITEAISNNSSSPGSPALSEYYPTIKIVNLRG